MYTSVRYTSLDIYVKQSSKLIKQFLFLSKLFTPIIYFYFFLKSNIWKSEKEKKNQMYERRSSKLGWSSIKTTGFDCSYNSFLITDFESLYFTLFCDLVLSLIACFLKYPLVLLKISNINRCKQHRESI